MYSSGVYRIISYLDCTGLAMDTVLGIDDQFLFAIRVLCKLIHLGRAKSFFNAS
jgi:hypothetical protein